MDVVLGIDVGTGGTRVVIVDTDGQVVASATAEHAPFASPRTAWAEQDPEDWWRASREAIREALKTAASNPGRFAPSVCPDRCTARCCSTKRAPSSGRRSSGAISGPKPNVSGSTRRSGPKRLLELTSNPALTNFTLPKLLWVRTHEPDAWKRVRHVLLPKDFVRLRLSGEYAIDVADASGTLMLDVAQRRWSQEVIDAAGIDSRTLPRVFESPDICAHVSARASSETGLVAKHTDRRGGRRPGGRRGGMGITRPGAVSVTIGTSGVVFAATDRPALDPKGRLHTFCHAIPDRWHVMGVTQAAGLSLRWMREQLGLKEHGDPGYEMMTREASAIEAGADGVLWAPYLMGERTPTSRSERARRARRSRRQSHARSHRPRGARGRGLQPARLVYDFQRAQGAGSADSAGRRWSTFRAVASDSGETCMGTRWRRCTPTKVRHTALRFSPVSAQASGRAWTKPAIGWWRVRLRRHRTLRVSR